MFTIKNPYSKKETTMSRYELPILSHFDPDKVGQVWRVQCQERAEDAKKWTAHHGIKATFQDMFRICLLIVDVQNTFCIPGFELFEGERSGTTLENFWNSMRYLLQNG
jgi:hypothetical protein